MNRNDLNLLKNKFTEYCREFYTSNEEDRKNISLKEQHTYNVCRDIVLLAEEQALNQNEILIAETAALFHDIGRFRQYTEFKTFRDSISVNHGELGARILKEKMFLKDLSENERGIIFTTVKFHNAFKIPDLKNSEAILFLKLVRDADKLDIWRLFIEYYESPANDRASAVGLGFPDTPEYSREILSRLYKKQTAPLSMIKTLNDFRLLQLSWIYDLNSPASLRLLMERDCINRIAVTLPWDDEIKNTVALLKKYAIQKMRE